MKLSDLLKILPEYQALTQDSLGDAEVKWITQDTRQVVSGSVYIAIQGAQFDGHQFLQNAIDLGAVALIISKGQKEKFSDLLKSYHGLVLEVGDTRESLQRLASHFYQDPTRNLLVFGVTGTNGKTSVTYMIEYVLNQKGIKCGVLGTINHHLGDINWDSAMTTPDPISLQKRIFEMKELGAQAIAMEVSSHALEQKRAHSVHFDRVIFTNLTQDHLDYHKTMDEYFRAKQILFTELLHENPKFPLFAIVNLDDPFGRKLRVSSRAGILTYGSDSSADFHFEIESIDFSGTTFRLTIPDVLGQDTITCKIPLIGQHNVANIISVVAALATVGVNPRESLKILESFPGVPGRLESVANVKGLAALVDYAHTPDALKNVLLSLQKVRASGSQNSKIWTVFGCGGDRDRTKRPLMAAIAEEFSDFVIATSDNPRTENPEKILEEVASGFKNKNSPQIFIEADRKAAIELALRNAGPQDVLLVAGKGHEDYQIIGATKIPFSDQKVIREFGRSMEVNK